MNIDQKRKAKTSEIKEGDQVLLNQNALSKMTPPFEPQRYRVVSKAGNSVTVKSPNGVQNNRNSSYLINGSKPAWSQEVLLWRCLYPTLYIEKNACKIKDFALYQ